MKNKTVKHQIDGLAALLLFAVFAVCVLIVLLTGARAYSRLTERDQSAFNQRTCMQYIAARVRQADSLGAVSAEDFNGVPALVLGAGEEYVTRVYCYEGWLMELYSEAGADLAPEDGEQLMEASSLELSLKQTVNEGGLELALQGKLLTATVTMPDGGTETLRLSLRGGEGAVS